MASTDKNKSELMPVLKVIKGAKQSNHETALHEGFIFLYRSIRKHWIWDDPAKLKWWLDILLEVNHKPAKVNIGYALIECNRGQSIRSLSEWAKRWRVDKSTVRRFLNLLQTDNMIATENVKKTTRLTVCNYATYNDAKHDKETIEKRSRNDEETRRNTNNNDNNVNNEITIKERKEIFLKKVFSFKTQYEESRLRKFFEHWGEEDFAGQKMKWELQETFDIAYRLKYWRDITTHKKNVKHAKLNNEPARSFD